MNRTIIRMLAYCLTCFTSIVGRTYYASADSGKIGHANYTSSGTNIYVRGYANYFLGIYCSTDTSGNTYCDGYDISKFYDRYIPPTTGTGSGQVGHIEPGEDNMICAWYLCTQNGKYTLKNCTTGMCNETGLYCSETGFFNNYGLSYTGANFYYMTDTKYAYSHCDAGWYTTSTGQPCDGSKVSSVQVIESCCEACPGYTTADNAITGITWTNETDSNCRSGWCWYSESSVGSGNGYLITSCRTYPDPKNKFFTDDSGTFTLEVGCPYVN